MNKYEYREPEFKLVMTAEQDIITASNPTNGTLGTESTAWGTNLSGNGSGGVGFGL